MTLWDSKMTWSHQWTLMNVPGVSLNWWTAVTSFTGELWSTLISLRFSCIFQKHFKLIPFQSASASYSLCEQESAFQSNCSCFFKGFIICLSLLRLNQCLKFQKRSNFIHIPSQFIKNHAFSKKFSNWFIPHPHPHLHKQT